MDFIRSLWKSKCSGIPEGNANKKSQRKSVSSHQRPSSSSKYSTFRKHESPCPIHKARHSNCEIYQNIDNNIVT